MSRDKKTHNPVAVDEASIGLRGLDPEGVISIAPSINSVDDILTDDDTDHDDNDDTFEYAVGRPQSGSCVTFCGNCFSRTTGKQHTRIVPCFMNTPIKWFRVNEGDSACYESCGYRCCFRLGNFTVLCEKQTMKESVHRSGSLPLHMGMASRRVPVLMVGPFWPFCLVVTVAPTVLIPVLIFIVFWQVVHIAIMLVLAALTITSLLSLACVACRDPGILRLTRTEPPESLDAKQKKDRARRLDSWTWNDQAQTWRPSGAVYDKDVNVVIQKFDHVCPFTGTAIGAGNLRSFNLFTISIQILLYYAIFVAGYSIYRARVDGYAPAV